MVYHKDMTKTRQEIEREIDQRIRHAHYLVSVPTDVYYLPELRSQCAIVVIEHGLQALTTSRILSLSQSIIDSED